MSAANYCTLDALVRPLLLDFYCGVGGWTKAFQARGWTCVGVDKEDFSAQYPGLFIQADTRDIDDEWIDQFDGFVSSPPCEEYARAWLPWLRGDHKPAQWAIDLLQRSVDLCNDRPNRLTECSVFAGKHVEGGTRFGSYVLWGDVPLLMPKLPRGKMKQSGMYPELRAEIPPALADWIAVCFTKNLRYRAAHCRANAELSGKESRREDG